MYINRFNSLCSLCVCVCHCVCVSLCVLMMSLAGYIGSRSFLEKVGDVVKELRSNNPRLTYGTVCLISPRNTD